MTTIEQLKQAVNEARVHAGPSVVEGMIDPTEYEGHAAARRRA